MSYIYKAQLISDPAGGFLVSFADIPEIITGGETRAAALKAASQALGMALRGHLGDGNALPSAKAKQGVPVTVDVWNTLKLAVMEAFEQSDMTKVELGCRLGKNEAEVRRILNWNHASKIQILEETLAVLGKYVVIGLKNAA